MTAKEKPTSTKRKESPGRPVGSVTESALATPTQIRAEMTKVYRLAKTKKLDSLVGVRLTSILKEILTCIRNGDLDERLQALEEKINANSR